MRGEAGKGGNNIGICLVGRGKRRKKQEEELENEQLSLVVELNTYALDSFQLGVFLFSLSLSHTQQS